MFRNFKVLDTRFLLLRPRYGHSGTYEEKGIVNDMVYVQLVGMTTILSNEDHVSTISEAYQDDIRTILFLKYVINDESYW